MGSRQADAVRQGLSRLVEAQATELTDAQLLHHFAVNQDEEAFAALLRRHGGLVYSVCRNILRDHHDAQDAFQGTFLVLARRAGAIREENALASWLYRVAYRVAMKARKAADRRRRQEAQAVQPEGKHRPCELAWQELQAMLDEELNRLPEKYRAPFVLCCLTGKSKSEAAADLGWKEGTVSSRLAQARVMLQARLARRGVALTAILSGLAISQNGALAVVPAGLLAATRTAALAFVGKQSLPPPPPAPVAFARAILWRMTINRLKPAVGLLALLAITGTAAAVAMNRPPDPEPPNPVVALAVAPPEVRKDEPAPARRMTVGGFVVGTNGKRVPGARVVVVAAQSRQPGEPHPGKLTMRVLGEGQADQDGQFRIEATQTTLGDYRLTAVATAPGYSPGSRTADLTTITASEHTLPIFLGRGRTTGVRFLDPEGRPAAGVRVRLHGLSRNDSPGIYVLFEDPPSPDRGWQDPGTTDAGGNITLHDIAAGTEVMLQVRDERFAPQWLRFRMPPVTGPDPVELKLSPVRTLEGRVTSEDTGEPLVGAHVIVDTSTPDTLRIATEARTDADGRFRLRPYPGPGVKVRVFPPPDRPYLELLQQFKWPADVLTHQVELSPLRGVLVRGTVVEEGSGRRVAGALVNYTHRLKDSPLKANEADRRRRGITWQIADARTRPDGTFSLAVPHGPGTLLVKAAEPDYIHVEIGSGRLYDGTRGGWPSFPDAFVPLSPTLAAQLPEVTVALRRGITVRGRVVGHDGRPVASAVLLCPSYLPEGMDVRGHPLPVRDGRFELPGCEPGGTVRVWVYDPRMKEGAVAEFKAGADEPEVRLERCVSARLRVVDPAGKPLAVKDWASSLLFRPGVDGNESAWKGTQARISVAVRRVNGLEYGPTDVGGNAFVFPDLIPGASYYVSARVGIEIPPILATFTAPRSGSLDLGDVILKTSDPSDSAPRLELRDR